MSQHDLEILTADANTGPSMRAAINAALQALGSNSSGATEPGTPYPYQFWADTTTGILKQRNASNTAWISLINLSTGGLIDGDKGDIIVSASGATWTIDSGVVSQSKLATDALRLVAEQTVVGSAATSVTFSNLDGNADYGYTLIGMRYGANGGAGLKIYFNGDTTDGNYNTQSITNVGDSVLSAYNYSAPWVDPNSALSSGNVDQIIANIDRNTRISCISEAHGVTGSTPAHNSSKNFISHLSNQSNITSITITGAAASDIGVGSNFKLYRRK